MSSIPDRDYYKFLFTPDSNESPFSSHENNLSENIFQQESRFCHQFENTNPKELPVQSKNHFIFEGIRKEVDGHKEISKCKSWSGSDMDISSSDSSDCSHNSQTSSKVSLSDSSTSASSQSHSDTLSDNSIFSNLNNDISPVFSYLEEEDIEDLLGENVQIPKPETQETLVNDNSDTIASFNVRNKYNHMTAAELLIQQKLTFLSIQEPYASSNKSPKSWKAFQKLELESARVTCYETPFQIILFDSWKWGGKILYPFQSLQYGRVTSIAFDLGNNQKIGIVSVYAPTRNNNVHHLPENKSLPTLKLTSSIINKIISRWKIDHPDMLTLILGDLQETVTSSDRDNLGKFRQEPTDEGVISSLSDSHFSIVRDKNPESTYVTRFGEEGARGIDHILFPVDEKFQNICSEAKIKRNVGASYFPSDHSLITCSIDRKGINNNCGGVEKAKYDFSKIFSIKLKQSGIRGQDLTFDTSQFKENQTFRDQAEMYKKVQAKTANDSNFTNAYLSELEDRTETLFRNLWKQGKRQKVNGSLNKLVRISDSNATELSYILKNYNMAVKAAMSDLKLINNVCTNESAGKVRGRLRKRNGFKIFSNLPVPTKLRYLRSAIENKIRAIQKNLYWIKEFNIRNKHESPDMLPMNHDEFWKEIIAISRSENLTKKANETVEAYKKEEHERMLHTSAIEFENNKKSTPGNKKQYTETSQSNDNTLSSVPNNVTKLLNFWLSNAGCNQGFDSNSSNLETSTAFLSLRINDWKEKILNIDPEEMNISCPPHLKMMKENLIEAENDLFKLSNQVTKLQTFYRNSTMEYFLDTCNINSFTRKVLPKGRSAPAAHTTIWDPTLQKFRKCKSEIEQLQATSDFHGKWMANSSAPETCAFAKIRKEGRLGNRGIILSPNRIITKEDIPSLIQNGKSLPKKIQKAFLKAHGPHTAKLFREPAVDNPEFFYPFYLTDANGNMKNQDDLEFNFWKAIATVPSKARFEGFQMAVIGRFDSRWRKLLFNLTKLILIMRYVPIGLKKMARFPIPKPGKQDEYRPISLCHDLYCYLMGVVTSYSSAAIERAGILHEGLTAYQKGKGCANLVTTELSFREDCLENHMPAVQIDEDEEKFFDRIPVEVLLAAMRVNGFPEQGYIEIKASAMEAKTVEIITAKGITYARFICGLEQGNPDSPTVSNLVIKFKHDVWNSMTEEIKRILKNNNSSEGENYKFNTIDDFDGPVYICKIGYSDDNSKYISVQNEDDLLFLVKYFTQLSGDISMVTKIGRKSAKCEIQFFNISAELAIKMKKVWSTAWSFIDDAPIEEQIPFKIHLKEKEREKFYILSNYLQLSEEDQLNWDNIISAKGHRHLGLTSTLNADTSISWTKTLEKMYERLSILNVHRMNLRAQKKCINMLVGTMPSFVPVQVNYPSTELLKFDQHIAKLCSKRNGLSKSDCKLRMFIPEEKGGLGFISTLELDIIAVAREFEIISNNITLDSRSFRTRIKAIIEYQLEDLFISKNHAREAITKLARYGIYIRDSKDGIINNILAKIGSSNKKFVPFNHPNYKDICRSGIGLGNETNIQLMLGGPVHKVIKALKENHWNTDSEITKLATNIDISIKEILDIHSTITTSRISEFQSFFSFWEWKNPSLLPVSNIPSHQKYWKLVDFSQIPKDFRKKDFNDKDIMNWHIRQTHLNWEHLIRYIPQTKSILFNSYTWEGKLLQHIFHGKSPLIVATDGAHTEKRANTSEKSSATNSNFTLCILDIRENESLSSGEWESRTVIPLLSRVSVLPYEFGTSTSDIAYGEFCAILMGELAFSSIPRITISDSKSIREQAQKIRDLKYSANDRNFIRSIAGGTGKFICGMMKDLIFRKAEANQEYPPSMAMQCLHENLIEKNREFLRIAKSWISPNPINKDSNELVGWEEEYFDSHLEKPIIKVNSHQLNSAGNGIKQPPRYSKLIPNLAVLSANHFADRCADYGNKFESASFSFSSPTPSLRFFISCGGKIIDRHISEFCHENFTNLKIRKLRKKKTQGLLWRILDSTTTSWDTLASHKGWRRSLLGLSSTHTRRIYKSEIYRACAKAYFISNSDDSNIIRELEMANITKSISMLGICLWCKGYNGDNGKGNRNHAILSCEHQNLKEFRIKSSNLIESKLRNLFHNIQQSTNHDNVIRCLHTIEKEFLQHQLNQTGRLCKMQKSTNTRYLPTKLILERESCESIGIAMNSRTFNFLSEVFGLYPMHNGSSIVRDEQIGIIDCPWLGLIPTFLDNILLQLCRSTRKFIPHKETADIIEEDLIHSWKEIKELIMAKAIAIHRIIGSTGTKLEKEWKKNFNIDIDSFKEIKKELNPNLKIKVGKKCSGKRRKIYCIPCTESANPIKKQRKSRSEINIGSYNSKSCTGISCNTTCKFWHPNSDFSPNQIRNTIRQCQRCSKTMTAIRQSKQILNDILAHNSEKHIAKLFKFVHANQNSLRYRYALFMGMLNACLPVHKQLVRGAQHINKVDDKNKTICNFICICINKFSPISPKNISVIIRNTIHFMNKILNEKEKEFKEEKSAELRIQQLQKNSPLQDASSIDSTLSSSISPTNLSLISTESDTKSHHTVQTSTAFMSSSFPPLINSIQNKPLQPFVPDILRPQRYLYGNHMSKAIDVLRSRKTQKLFIASAEAAPQISNWNLQGDWREFARMFFSYEVIHHKPNGTYLIPLFTGQASSGHWYLCVIQKIGRRHTKAWCLDSLGNANMCDNTANKIKAAFSPGRGIFEWVPQNCRTQQEVECGHRTILAMKIIQEGLDRSTPLEVCIQHATLHHPPYDHLSPTFIRESIAGFVNDHTPSMTLAPIRFRSRQERNHIRPTQQSINKIEIIDLQNPSHSQMIQSKN